MKPICPAVRRETAYIAVGTGLLSLLMQSVFLVIGRWEIPVLFGNLWGAALAVTNFFLMGLTVQSATACDEKRAREKMRLSQTLRTAALFVLMIPGVLLPCFQTVACVLPLLFPRIAIAFRPLFGKGNGETPSQGGKRE